ncbi:trypsin-like peptidase domain-containing protein [Panacibacter sp. DH6]|uniref:Trypsin-like peptidase domain-containing protein n=2 Tax=Panacibacter microcysteis TaxID=2793269 RepID=A0A931E5A5_9BACT|nr:trypsin-like peptidase domain-containing protein [Panacibacter microcysteis]
MMEDILLLETIERYLSGNMLPEEKNYFEQLRKNTPEIDQMVVEHKLFLQQMEHFSANQNLKNALHTAHNNLVEKGAVNEGGPVSAKGKVIQLWDRYKRVTAIAASIAGVTAIVISGLVSYFTPASNNHEIQQLSRAVSQVVKNQQAIGAKLDLVDSKIPKNVELTSSGSAFLIDGKGYLVTNAHVLKGSGAVVADSKGREFNARIINIDNASDIAILKIQDEEYKPVSSLPYGIKQSNIDLGEELFTLGYPREQIVYNMGYLSSETGFKGDTATCQISLSANPGNSGGPVFNKNGEIIGILSTRETSAEGVVFAIKSQEIYKLVNDLRESDTAVQKIKMPVSSSIRKKTRVEQIKEVSDCVYLVKSYAQK